MNSRYVASPDLCENPRDLALVLRSFGPAAGRYLIKYPLKWTSLIEKNTQNWSPLDLKRAKELLFEAQNSKRLLDERLLVPKGTKAWNPAFNWNKNLSNLMVHSCPVIDGVLANSTPEQFDAIEHVTLDDLPFHTNEDETILSEPAEFQRVSKYIVKIHTEIVFVDPYLDLSKKAVADSVKEIIKTIPESDCESVKFFVSHAHVNHTSIQRSLLSLKRLLPSTSDVSFVCNLIDDRRSANPMHARYLFGVYGGIRVDRGFRAHNSKRNDISPLGQQVVRELVNTYISTHQTLDIVDTFKV